MLCGGEGCCVCVGGLLCVWGGDALTTLPALPPANLSSLMSAFYHCHSFCNCCVPLQITIEAVPRPHVAFAPASCLKYSLLPYPVNARSAVNFNTELKLLHRRLT